MIHVKDISVYKGLLARPNHPTLIRLFCWLEERHQGNVLTCAYEARSKGGVHTSNPVRGWDLRSWIYDDPKAIADEINEHWIYDPQRPELKCCIFHDVGRGAHFHLQVHPNTQLRF